MSLIYYDTADLIDSTCESLLQRAQLHPSQQLIIGFDVEYEVEFDGQSGVISKSGTSGCDVIQIAVSDAVYVFKVNNILYLKMNNILFFIRSHLSSLLPLHHQIS